MNYQVQEILRGIGMGKIDEAEGMAVVNEWVALELKTQKLIKPLFENNALTTGGSQAQQVA